MSLQTYPPCPNCETDVLVEHSKSNLKEYVCHGCDTKYNR
jgi:transposase-like protein